MTAATITHRAAKLPKGPLKLAAAAWFAGNLALAGWIASPQLSQAAQAVSDLAPVCAQYLRLKAEGKL